MRRYTVHLIPDPEDGGYTATVPTLPGCITEGDTFLVTVVIGSAVAPTLIAQAFFQPNLAASVQESAAKPAGAPREAVHASMARRAQCGHWTSPLGSRGNPARRSTRLR